MSGLNLNDLMNSHGNATENTQQPHSQAQPTAGNRYLNQPELGLALCASLLSNNTEQQLSAMLDAFQATIEQDFLALSERDENPGSVKAYVELQRLSQRLQQVVSFPALELSRTVAVGGAFSSGKSRFLNAIVGTPSLLPTDTTPTTSIPTYLYKGQQNRIDALNVYRHKTAIDEEALKAICHEFHQRFGVSFSHLLQMIAVERQEFPYPYLIFLDTPGYSKHDEPGHGSDAEIAREQLRNAEHLLWLIDVQNGTIPKPDIEFLHSLDLVNPPLIIFNKADKKPEKELHGLIAQARIDLEKHDLPSHDVIAYSAAQGLEYSASRKVLVSFLDSINKPRQGSPLCWQLQQIFRHHSNAYDSHSQSLELTWQTANEVLFDEKIQAQHKKHLQDLRSKVTQRMDLNKQHKTRAEKIAADCTQQLEALCQQLAVPLAERPETLQPQGRTRRSALAPITVEALLSGDLHSLAHLATLSGLTAKIGKASPMGWYVSLQENSSLEILIMKQQLVRTVGAEQLHKYVEVGMPVTVKIIHDKRVEVTLDPNDLLND